MLSKKVIALNYKPFVLVTTNYQGANISGRPDGPVILNPYAMDKKVFTIANAFRHPHLRMNIDKRDELGIPKYEINLPDVPVLMSVQEDALNRNLKFFPNQSSEWETSFAVGEQIFGQGNFETFAKTCHPYWNKVDEGVSVVHTHQFQRLDAGEIDITEGDKFTRKAVYEVLRYGSTNIVNISVHLAFDPAWMAFDKGNEIRKPQIDKLLSEINWRFNHEDIIIISGDWNMPPGAWAFDNVWKAGFKDANYGVDSSKRQTMKSAEGNVPGATIDHVVIRNNHPDKVKVDVIWTAVGENPGSDHDALFTGLKVTPL